MNVREFDEWIDQHSLQNSIFSSSPFCCRKKINPDLYCRLVLSLLAGCSDKVDVSCCEDNEPFNGNPLFREKVDIKASDFACAWTDCRIGRQHRVLDSGLQLYLSQCCFQCKDEPAVCDIEFMGENNEDSIKPPDFLLNGPYVCKQSNLWMNLQSAISTLHYDASHNLLMLVEGTKEIKIIAPCHTAKLHPVPASDENPNHSTLSPVKVDEIMKELNEYAYTITLNAGDVLFIPQGWWHQVHSSPCSMALNFWFDITIPKLAPSCVSTVHMLPFKLRQMVHDLSASTPLLSTSTVTNYKLYNYDCDKHLDAMVFESKLLGILLSMKHVVSSGEKRRIHDITVDTDLVREVIDERKYLLSFNKEVVETGAGSIKTEKEEEALWLEFVHCGVHQQIRLWTPFAAKVNII